MDLLVHDLKAVLGISVRPIRHPLFGTGLQLVNLYATKQNVNIWTWYCMYAIFILPWLLLQNGPSKQAAQRISRHYGLFTLSKTLHWYGAPRELPNHVYVSVHHRWTATPMEFHLIFAMLQQYDEIHVAIGLNTHKLRPYKLDWIPSAIFGAIDLRQLKTSEDKYFALLRPMQDAIRDGRSCAIVVFPDIAGSTQWGDRSMTCRDGLFAASMCTGLPIVDHLHFEPTVQGPHTTIHTTMRWPNKQHCNSSMQDARAYQRYREAYSHEIAQWTSLWESHVISTVETFETSHEGCFVDDSEATCSTYKEHEIFNNLRRNLRAKAFRATHERSLENK
jgi:hypothetical protein